MFEERMDMIVPATKNYFSSWHSHDIFGYQSDNHPEPYILENAIYAYPRGRAKFNILREINITYSGNIENVFFDMEKLWLDIDSKHIYNAIRIRVNEKSAGYYLPSINTLVLSDWTHDRECAQVFISLWPELVEKLSLRVIDVKPKLIPIGDVTVGCDPEFELIQGNEVINAEEEIDSDNWTNSIGTDGAGDQIEIRPEPGDHIKVTQNIKKLMKRFSEEFDEFQLGDTGNRYPLGGHIHVGIGMKYRPPTNLLHVLDDFIGRPVIKLSGKARGSYMVLSEARQQPHGFEYRSPPAAIFQNPAITCIVLKLARNLTKKYLNGDFLSYNDTPTEEDYIKVGNITKSQAKYFIKFCNGGYKSSNNVVKEWLQPRAPDKVISYPSVIFRDSWYSDIRRNLRKELGKISVSRPITVVLYGLSNKVHGINKCTLPMGNISSIAVSKPIWNSDRTSLQVGVSFDRRHDNYDIVFGNALVKTIAEKLQEV